MKIELLAAYLSPETEDGDVLTGSIVREIEETLMGRVFSVADGLTGAEIEEAITGRILDKLGMRPTKLVWAPKPKRRNARVTA